MSEETPNILIIDDQQSVCWAMAELAKSMGYAAETANDAAAGLGRLVGGSFDAVILDIQLPGLNGLDALPKIKADFPHLPVVIITAHGTMATAIAAVQRGAFEYLLKPVDKATLKTVLSAAVAHHRRSAELGAAVARPISETEMIGRCPQIQEVFKQIAVAAGTELAVLLTGETGTGKELVARAIHRYSSRGGGPFVAVNCSLLSGELVASELFGHEKGAFTGADRAAPGKVEAADGGTMLLDEVGELPGESQVRLLRFLDDGEFYRVGSAEPARANVRAIAATNRPLRAAALSGHFRRDLFFRISGVTIDLPPLRDRGDDVELLIDHFLGRCHPAGLTDEARTVLKAYPYPGNVRELRNAIEHAAAMAGAQPIGPEHLPEALSAPGAPEEGASLERWADRMLERILAAGIAKGYEELMAQWESPVLAAAMRRFEGNQARVAAALSMHRSTLRKKLRAYGLIEPAGADAAS